MTIRITIGIMVCAAILMGGESRLAANESTHTARFDTSERPDEWSVNFGHWEPSDGHLVAKQLDKDNHAAASRWKIPFSDGIVRLKVRFDKAKQFHVGFDPKPGTLQKKGHLYSLVVSPTSAAIKKHKDKAKSDSTDEVLTTASFEPGLTGWTEIELTAIGNTVKAKIGKVAVLEASDPTFHVAKPTVVFRVIGDAVHFDDVEVTVLKP